MTDYMLYDLLSYTGIVYDELQDDGIMAAPGTHAANAIRYEDKKNDICSNSDIY